MKIEQNFSLKKYNTFGIEAFAKEFVSVSNIEELKNILIQYKNKNIFILGGGSNMLLTKDIDALVIHIDFLGQEIVFEDDNYIHIKCNAGEKWHDFVIKTINNNWGGLENMSLIPGNVGTTPVQNIGAYGVEIKDSMISCEALDIKTLEIVNFSNKDCQFGYRESIFKNIAKNKYIINSVTFKLSKNNHVLHTQYGDIMTELGNQNITNPSIKDISNAVIAIRKSKLPDPNDLGNSGSFFKNPIISKSHFDKVISTHPEVKYYQVSETEYKIPAGWLIENVGMKGYREGDAGVHEKQALVLVNYGNATGDEILKLSKKIQEKVFQKYSISIEAEVNII